MPLSSDLLIDRRRLKRRLSVWQGVALAAVLVAGFALARGNAGGGVFAGRHIARLFVSGIITDDGKRTSAVSALATDSSVAALEVLIDSPGGTVGGGEALHAAIKKVAAVKPVVTVMRGTAASAGYMIAVPAARIFARGSTLTGSIGVLLQSPEVSTLANNLGVHVDVIASGPLKDEPNPFHPLSDEGRVVLKGIIADLYDQFVGIVAEGRHMSTDSVRALADGRAYTGRQAVALGLVDEIGGETEARAWLTDHKQVPRDLRTVDLDTDPDRGAIAKLAGSMGGALGNAISPFLSGFTRNLLGQRLALEEPLAVWQSPAVGESSGGTPR